MGALVVKNLRVGDGVMDYAPSKAANNKAAYSTPRGESGYVSEVDALRCVAMTACRRPA